MSNQHNMVKVAFERRGYCAPTKGNVGNFEK